MSDERSEPDERHEPTDEISASARDAIELPVHRRRRRRATPRPGQAPGRVTPPADAHPSEASVIGFGAKTLVEREIDDVEEIATLRAEHDVVWLNVDGLADAKLIEHIGEEFGFHPLALEDTVNPHQRPKIEVYPDHVYAVARMPHLGTGATPGLEMEQVSVFFGPGFVVSFQERSGDCFGPVRERLRAGRPRIRESGADYLAYALLDALVDSNFPILEKFGDYLEDLEEQVLGEPTADFVSRIYSTRRELLRVRRATWPLRDALGTLLRDAPETLSEDTLLFLRDVQDHAIQIVDLVETYRETASSLLDFYLSSLSHKMNEVMKVLTIIATIFIPLGFIAGLYGMNFDTDSPWNLPELGWRFGYPAAVLAMGSIAVGMLFYFRRKGWIGRS